MSEHLQSQESGKENLLNTSEVKDRNKELLDEAKKEAAEAKNKHQEKLDQIRNEIETEALASKDMSIAEASSQEEPESANTYWNSQEYRDIAFGQFMNKVRKHLGSSEKIASKILHKPLVEKASEISGKTIARPSGVLAGSIFSFIISLVTFYIAKRNNYDMTYSIFIVSFIGGFIFGVIVEFIYRGIRALLSRD